MAPLIAAPASPAHALPLPAYVETRHGRPGNGVRLAGAEGVGGGEGEGEGEGGGEGVAVGEAPGDGLTAAVGKAPFTLEAAPCPISVAVVPSGETRRTRLLLVSATTTKPDQSTPTPLGPLNSAAPPKPSAHPAAPAPARVATAPVAGFTDRRALLAESAT